MTRMQPLLIGLLEGKRISGVQLSFKLLTTELTRRNYRFRVVNLGNYQVDHRVGEFSWRRSFEIIRAILKAWFYYPVSNRVYLTIGLSRLGFLRDMLILLPAFIMRKRTIIHVHSGGYGEFYMQQPPLIQKLIKFTISKVDTIIILSKSLIDQFYFLEKPPKYIPVYNMIDPGLLTVKPINKQLDPSRPIKLLYLSNMMIDKGYLELLEACRILKECGRIDFECKFCGEFIQTANDLEQSDADIGEQKQSFLKKIKQYNLDNNVHYLGVVKGETKLSLLQESHLFILPTRYPWEGQPASILEAMASGIPVIATNYRSIPDQVQDGVNGFLLKEPNPAEIAEYVEELWKNPQKYSEMSQQAVRKFREDFSPELRMEKMIGILFGK